MTKTDRDILRDIPQLKTTPFDVADGYFDQLKQDLKAVRTPDVTRVIPWKKTIAYTAVAATFALLVATGALFLDKVSRSDFTEEDYIVFSSSSTNILYYEYDEYFADAENIASDDIAEYLIYTGETIESIESNE